VIGGVIGRQELRSAEQPRVLDALSELCQADPVQVDEDDRMPVVVGRLKVSIGERVDEQRLLVRVIRTARAPSAERPGLSQAKSFPSTLNAGCA
jgi:hypothetical protein